MTAAPRIDQYELYRVISDYEALQDGFLDRIDDLETTISGIPGFADGALQKLLSKNPGQRIERKRDHRFASAQRTFGWKTLGEMLNGMDAVMPEDEWVFPIFEKAQELWPTMPGA